MRLLVFRLSAMGDVALTVPALRAVLEANPGLHISFITRNTFAPFFEDIPRFTLISPDLSQYKGFTGLYRLFRKLRKENDTDAVADLHDVLRTKVLRCFFRFAGIPVYKIDKGRSEKRMLIKGKLFRPLKHSIERYLDVFRQAGLRTLPPGPGPHIHVPEVWKSSLPVPTPEGLKVGIAPCSRHILKTWPHDGMIRLMKMIREEKKKVTFYLFGGPEDREVLEKIAEAVGGNVYLNLSMSLRKQLVLMQQMHWVISMDSANMHLAALLGVPVISIWGATHPYSGFAPWGADEKWQVQIPKEELPCRPCTVYGKGRCRRGDLACLNRITPERIMATMV